MSDGQDDAEVEREPVGDLSVEREGADVLIRINADGEEREYYIPPEYATRVALWLQSAAVDAKRYEREVLADGR